MHLRNRCETFATLTEPMGTVRVEDHDVIEFVGYGAGRLSKVVRSAKGTVLLRDVLCAPDLMYNFISSHKQEEICSRQLLTMTALFLHVVPWS